MPLYRNSFVLLDVTVPTAAPQVGPAFRVRPSDGDGISDHDQQYRCLLDVQRIGPGAAQAQLWTSWDGIKWVPVAQVDVNGPEPQHFELLDLAAFGPFVQARSTVFPANPGDPLPNHRATVRLASDGSFNLRPV